MGTENAARITSEMFRSGEVYFKLLNALHSKKFRRELIEVGEEHAVVRCTSVSGSGGCELVLDRLKIKEDHAGGIDVSFTYIGENERGLLREIIKDNPNLTARFCFFDGGFDLSGLKFENLEMLCSTFRGYADFNGSVFRGETNFSWSTFEGNANFNGAVFDGDANFSWSVFQGYADFNKSTFEGNANFNRSSFEGDADTNMPMFEIEDVFTESAFKSAGVNMPMFEGNVNFNETVFKSHAYFIVSRFTGGNANFNGTTFQNNVYFNGSKFEGIFRFSAKTAKRVCLDSAVFENAVYLSGPIKSLEITDTVFRAHLKADWNKGKVEEAIKEKLTGKSERGRKPICETVSKEFIILKEKYHSQGEYFFEDRAYVAFRRAERETKGPFSKTFSYFADWVGNYGTSPIRVAAWMLIIVAVFGLFYTFALGGVAYSHGVVIDTKMIMESFYASGITFTTIGLTQMYPAEMLPRFMIAVVAEGFLGVFLIAYFTICFSRKMLR